MYIKSQNLPYCYCETNAAKYVSFITVKYLSIFFSNYTSFCKYSNTNVSEHKNHAIILKNRYRLPLLVLNGMFCSSVK